MSIYKLREIDNMIEELKRHINASKSATATNIFKNKLRELRAVKRELKKAILK